MGTAAAPNTNFGGEIWDPLLVLETMRSIFLAPKILQPNLRVLVLGAWGCGAFGGDPGQMGDLFAEALGEGLGSLYDEVHFAIPVSGDRNADAFRRALQNAGMKLTEL